MARFTGTSGRDVFVQGSRVEVEVFTLGGNDTITLNRTDDLGGFNVVDAGNDNDGVFNLFEGGNEINLGSGTDRYEGTGFAGSSGRVDRVFGGAGNDTMAVTTFHSSYFGEADNDTFFTEGWQNFFDGGAGTDRLSFELRDISNTLGGTGVIVDLAQGFANTGASRIEEFANIEDINTTNVSDEIYGSAVANTLKGLGGVDLIVGRAGNDTLDGGAGADEMVGGAGNDTYIVDNVNDIVDEFNDAPSGVDTVRSSISFNLTPGARLGGSVENVVLTGTGAINATGNTLANVLVGNTAANTLDGGDNNDTLAGGLGKDVLTGGSGADSFRFDTRLSATSNVDRITDFNVPDDRIQLENAIFTAIRGTGTLTAAQFTKNTTGAAGDANDRIIYETDTGKIFYDSNGSASGGSVHFATVGTNLTLTNADFFVI